MFPLGSIQIGLENPVPILSIKIIGDRLIIVVENSQSLRAARCQEADAARVQRHAALPIPDT